ncbi:MAG: diaminopimelate decarboxylase [Candidatus Parcubacteria bacterium]|jgi:diaminopimelate decarboxylase|nr:diaminopimelate decarboxylase [Candidatus Parcubacteria bacterium]
MFIPTKEQAESIAEEYGTPTFVTDAAAVTEQARKMLDAFKDLPAKIFYAIKTNSNPHIVRLIKDAGIYGIDAVSSNEVRLALELGYRPEQVIFTPSNPSTDAIREVGEQGVLQNLGSLSEISRFCGIFPGGQISVRICPEVAAGEFEANLTGGIGSKFGISLTDMKEAQAICKVAGVSIVGIHGHIGSGFYEPSAFRKAVTKLCEVAMTLPEVTFVDVGGGYGVRYLPGEEEVDIGGFAREIGGIFTTFAASTKRDIQLYLEPGKFLVSTTTVLLARVTTIKEKDGTTFVGLDTGFNHLIRPAMYGAYHHIVNVSRPGGAMRKVAVVGYLCESADVFNRDIELADPREGDLVAILVSGGHASVLSSNYNLNGFAAEVLITGNKATLTKKRQTYEEMLSLFTPREEK